MLFKVAMLSAVGDFNLAQSLVVTEADIRRAAAVITRWATFADAFQARLGETQHDKDWKAALAWMKRESKPAYRRRTVMRALHFDSKRMDAAEATLTDRGHIQPMITEAEKNEIRRRNYKCSVWKFLDYERPTSDSGPDVAGGCRVIRHIVTYVTHGPHVTRVTNPNVCALL